MPIVKVECPACGKQPTDHFNGSHGHNSCTLSPSERNWYHWIIQHEMSDTLHADGTLTPTRLLTCPREVLFSDFLPYTLLLANCHPTAVGTKFHEATSRSPLRLRGKLFGLDIEGECDNSVPITDDDQWIDDTKYHSDFRMSKLRDNGEWEHPSVELRVQLSIYKILWEQMYKSRVTRLTASHFSPYFGFRVVEVPAMTEDELGGVRPLGNPFTVRQLAGFYVNGLSNAKEWDDSFDEDIATAIARAVPAVGREMIKTKDGSWKCNHCNHRVLCDSFG